jgi:flagellar basal body-associated protein FliL
LSLLKGLWRLDDLPAEKRRTFVIVVGTIGLLALLLISMAVLARRSAGSGSSTPGIYIIPMLPSHIFYIFIVLVFLMMVGSFVFSLIFIMRSRTKKGEVEEQEEQEEEEERHLVADEPSKRVLVFFVVLLLVVIGLFLFLFLYNPKEKEEPAENGASEELFETQEQIAGEPFDQSRARNSYAFGYIMAIAVVLFFGSIFVFSARLLSGGKTEDEEIEPEPREKIKRDLVRAVDIGIERIAGERDFRKAVIACYAGMERVMERHHLPRRRHETPMEFVSQVIAEFTLPSEGLLDLTRLYEIAKFSTLRIDRTDKEIALGYLDEIKSAMESS